MTVIIKLTQEEILKAIELYLDSEYEVDVKSSQIKLNVTRFSSCPDQVDATITGQVDPAAGFQGPYR